VNANGLSEEGMRMLIPLGRLVGMHGEDDLMPEGSNLLVGFEVNTYLASGSVSSGLGSISKGTSHKGQICTKASAKSRTQGSAAMARPSHRVKSTFIVNLSRVAEEEDIAEQVGERKRVKGMRRLPNFAPGLKYSTHGMGRRDSTCQSHKVY
jgi:hypothetical protein